MAEYALLDTADTILEYRDHASVPPDLTRKGLRWLPVEVTDPAYDSETHVREGPTITILVDKVTRVWTVRAKTAAEIDAEKTEEIDNIDLAGGVRALGRALFEVVNEIRGGVFVPKPALTPAQFRAYLKSLL